MTVRSSIFAILVVSGAALSPAQGDTVSVDDEVRFVVWGDSQFANKPLFERLVHETDLLNPDFVIQVGDMIQGYTYDAEAVREEWKLYNAQIEPLTMPFHPVPGNHDVVTTPSEEVYKEVWGEDKLVYSFDYGSVHCIVLDSYFGEEDERIAEWQREWLANDLFDYAAANGGENSAELASKSIFVFLHAPLWRYKSDHPGRQDWDEVHQLLQRYPVKLVVGGHTHEYVWEDRDGIDYLVMNSSGSMGNRSERGGSIHALLHVSVRDGQDVRYGVIKAGSVLPLDTVNSPERADVPRYALGGGTIRFPEWQPGAAFDKTITIDLANNLDEPRVYNLRWEIPRGADVAIEPLQQWLELSPKESASPEFLLTTGNAPGNGMMPVLRVSTTHQLRSGVVSREWEEEYRRREILAQTDSSILPTNIRLEKEYTFDAAHRIFVPPVAFASPLEGQVVLDGKLDESPWDAAEPVGPFSPGDVDTRVHFLYDDDYLYVGAWLGEPNPGGMRAEAGGDIPLTWSDDDFELFFDPQNTGRLYTRLFQNVAGTRFNSLPRHVENKYFTSVYESAIHIGDDHWAIEMRIPWEEMTAEKAPAPGDFWAINVGRHRQQSEPARSAWTPGLYDASRYGVLKFR